MCMHPLNKSSAWRLRLLVGWLLLVRVGDMGITMYFAERVVYVRPILPSCPSLCFIEARRNTPPARFPTDRNVAMLSLALRSPSSRTRPTPKKIPKK